MTIRHDAAVCRRNARSERIRIEQGILTPEERRRKEEAERRRQLDQLREAAKGPALGLEDLQ
jgi:hypothetical protein